MTQTMREQLQVAVSNIKAYIEFRKHAKQKACAAALQSVCDELESILAIEPPAVAHRCNICGGLVQFDGTKPSVSIGPGGKQQ